MKIINAKNFILSPLEENTITPIKQNELESTRRELIKEMFSYNTLTGRNYQKFIHRFIQYTTGMFKLDEIKILFDSSMKSTEGYQLDNEKLIGLGKFLYVRPSYPEKFFDFLNTIVHEISHTKELSLSNYTYKKFSNEDNTPIRNDLCQGLDSLGFYVYPRQRKQMHHYGLSTYYLSPWEMYARKTANEEMDKILQDAKKLIKEKIIPPTKQTFDLLKHFYHQQELNMKDEMYFQKSSKFYISNHKSTVKITKQSLQEILDVLYSTKGEPNIDIIANLLPVFYDTQLTCQPQLNRLNNYLIKQAMITTDEELASIMLSYSLALSITKPNKNSKVHFENVYKIANVLENKKFPNLMNSLQYEAIDFLITEPYFTIDKSYLENEYKKYHPYSEFEKYFAEQKQKGKEEEENRKINHEIYLEK